MLAFIDVDTLNDFFEGGKLAVPNADSIRKNLTGLTSKALSLRIPILAFCDAHPEDAEEFKTFPDHCIIKTPGADKIDETSCQYHGGGFSVNVVSQARIDSSVSLISNSQYTKANMIIFQKNTYDAFDPELGNPNIEVLLKEANIDEVVVYGVVTEICVDAAVRGLLARNITVHVVTDAIMHLDETKMDKCFKEWYEQGVYFTTTNVVLL